MQLVVATVAGAMHHLHLPAPSERLGDGALAWGAAEEVCTPAYWAAQSWMWEIEDPEHYRLGRTLEEETLACLLGGYGIPAEVGIAAYARVRAASRGDIADEERVCEMLLEPLMVRGRAVRYRFARQKARHVAKAFRDLPAIDDRLGDRQLRDALIGLSGVGPKTASWIVRNWRGSDEVSILDVHILRAGRRLGIFPAPLTVERHYGLLEEAYLAFAAAIGARASILDSVMWMTMRQLPSSLFAGAADAKRRVRIASAFPRPIDTPRLLLL